MELESFICFDAFLLNLPELKLLWLKIWRDWKSSPAKWPGVRKKSNNQDSKLKFNMRILFNNWLPSSSKFQPCWLADLALFSGTYLAKVFRIARMRIQESIKDFWSKKILVQKMFLVKKKQKFSLKINLVQTIFWSKEVLSKKRCWSKKVWSQSGQ